jgi:hypothetical protein
MLLVISLSLFSMLTGNLAYASKTKDNTVKPAVEPPSDNSRSGDPGDQKNNPPPQDKQCMSLECKTPPKEDKPICPDVFPSPPGCGPVKEKPPIVCPPGTHKSHNKCVVDCPPGFKPRHGICNKDIFITVHKKVQSVTNSVNTGSVSMSKACFDVISLAWNTGIQKGQDPLIDNFINNCLGVA